MASIYDTSAAAWDIRALGDCDAMERAYFYEELSEGQPEEHFFFGDSKSDLYENPRLDVRVLADNGTEVTPETYSKVETLSGAAIDVYLEYYHVSAMPGRVFDLQLAAGARHIFDDAIEPTLVAHTLGVKGVIGDRVNYLAEPIFSGVRVKHSLTLDLAILFLTDRATERLLALIKSPELQHGLKLAALYNPVFGATATYVRGIVETLAAAKKNMAITDAHVTFTSVTGLAGLPLIAGTYVLFQPSSKGEEAGGSALSFDMTTRTVIRNGAPLERNHMLLRIAPS